MAFLGPRRVALPIGKKKSPSQHLHARGRYFESNLKFRSDPSRKPAPLEKKHTHALLRRKAEKLRPPRLKLQGSKALKPIPRDRCQKPDAFVDESREASSDEKLLASKKKRKLDSGLRCPDLEGFNES